MAAAIKDVTAREVMTNKGIPTVEVDVILDDGSIGRAAAPGGTSRGGNEAKDLFDHDPAYFQGRGVNKAISNVKTEIAACLKGKNALDQVTVDGLLKELDGTDDKSRLGCNAIIATSIANAKAAAESLRAPLFRQLGGGNQIPLPFIYVMFGGPAYVGLEGTCDFQEYALIPLKAKTYKEGYLSSLGIYRRLCNILGERTGHKTPNYPKLGGALTARFDSNEEALAVLTELIAAEGYVPGQDFGICLDIAASQLYKDGKYHLQRDHLSLSRDEMIAMLGDLCAKYPIVSMEDCLFEDDWEGWKILTSRLGKRVQLVGDDLFVTNPQRLKQGIELGVANGIIIKPNQIGTLTETAQAISIAKDAGYSTMISPRSGELWDPYIVHLCVGQSLGQGKIVGAYPSGEANLNELLRVRDALGKTAVQADMSVLHQFK